jgi:SAM-dependent methyltransferase
MQGTMATTEQKTGEVRVGYDFVAEEYASHLFDELRQKPLDCELLDRFAARVKGAGLVCDLGCGPGQVAHYLRDRGVAVCGMDLSPKMVEQARRLSPGIEFSEGDMLALPVADENWAGIAAFYAIVNLPPDDHALAMREMCRALKPGGWLLLSFHVGGEIVHVDNLWGCATALDFYFFRTGQVTECLRAAGFSVDELIEREPYPPEVEYQSRRAYIFACKQVTTKS